MQQKKQIQQVERTVKMEEEKNEKKEISWTAVHMMITYIAFKKTLSKKKYSTISFTTVSQHLATSSTKLFLFKFHAMEISSNIQLIYKNMYIDIEKSQRKCVWMWKIK